MSVGLLLITHDNLAQVLIDTARVTLCDCPLSVGVINASRECDPEEVLVDAQAQVCRLDSGNGVLVLTDLFGATPSNVAARLSTLPQVRVVAGINLPMLLRVLNYPDADLEILAAKALEAGKAGVVSIEQRN